MFSMTPDFVNGFKIRKQVGRSQLLVTSAPMTVLFGAQIGAVAVTSFYPGRALPPTCATLNPVDTRSQLATPM